MNAASFSDMIQGLPDVDLDVPGIRGKLLQGEDQQVVFFTIERTAAIPFHSHGAQWGIVVEGEMDLTIGGVTRTYRQGDSYAIPAGVEHGASFRTDVRAIDVFDEPARYRPRAAPAQ